MLSASPRDFLFRSPSPVLADSLRRVRLQRLLLEVGPQLYEQLSLLGLTRRGKFQLPSRHVVVRCLPKRLPGERNRGLRYLALHRLPDEFFFLGLCLPPVLRSECLS